MMICPCPLFLFADQGGLMLDVSLEYAQGDKQKHTVLLLAYIMRRRGREQVKVGQSLPFWLSPLPHPMPPSPPPPSTPTPTPLSR
jgi:hypothetical protein